MIRGRERRAIGNVEAEGAAFEGTEGGISGARKVALRDSSANQSKLFGHRRALCSTARISIVSSRTA